MKWCAMVVNREADDPWVDSYIVEAETEEEAVKQAIVDQQVMEQLDEDHMAKLEIYMVNPGQWRADWSNCPIYAVTIEPRPNE